MNMGKTLGPCYIIEEEKLRKNLNLIRNVSLESGAEIILALKAFANWKLFPIIKEYIDTTTASSLYEARLSYQEFKSKAHTYSPAYEEGSFDELMGYSKHITFNSLTQFERFKNKVQTWNSSPGHHKISMGLRINPEYSEITTDLYNPCARGSRFGVLASQLTEIPDSIEGLHFHCLCENNSSSLVNVLEKVEILFGHLLDKIKWLNVGGGHLMTREGYDISLLINKLKSFQEKHPNLKIILEPGSAFLWKTGFLTSQVVDIVENKDIKTVILNVSFTCHMPDCLEMPYQPEVRNAIIVENPTEEVITSDNVYRLGGNSCLSGDYIGYWKFENPLHIGDNVIFEDMIHYTTVKTNMFNGINHPSIALKEINGNIKLLREFTYEDYKCRMD